VVQSNNPEASIFNLQDEQLSFEKQEFAHVNQAFVIIYVYTEISFGDRRIWIYFLWLVEKGIPGTKLPPSQPNLPLPWPNTGWMTFVFAERTWLILFHLLFYTHGALCTVCWVISNYVFPCALVRLMTPILQKEGSCSSMSHLGY
jgi:hypothetical protein